MAGGMGNIGALGGLSSGMAGGMAGGMGGGMGGGSVGSAPGALSLAQLQGLAAGGGGVASKGVLLSASDSPARHPLVVCYPASTSPSSSEAATSCCET